MSKSLRVSRSELFMQTAELFARQSTCLRGNVGAVIVKDRRIISCGYNGAPPGMESCIEAGKCLPLGSSPSIPDDELVILYGCQRATHAEANAIAWAAREGVRVINSTMYATHSPCLSCARLCIAAGIRWYVYRKEYRIVEGKDLLLSAGVDVRKLEALVVPDPE